MDLEGQLEELGVLCPRCHEKLNYDPGRGKFSWFRCSAGCDYRLSFKQAWGVMLAARREKELSEKSPGPVEGE